MDERLKKVEQRNRTVIGFQTDCIGVEAPLLSDDDWPDDDFFWVESKRKVKQ